MFLLQKRKGQEEIFGGHRYVYYVDCGGSFMSVRNTLKPIKLHTLHRWSVFICQLHSSELLKNAILNYSLQSFRYLRKEKTEGQNNINNYYFRHNIYYCWAPGRVL